MIIPTFSSDLIFREAGMYGRTAGKDGIISAVREPNAEFHVCSAEGFREAPPDWQIRPNFSPAPI